MFKGDLFLFFSSYLGDFEMLAGNLASIGVGGIVTCVTSIIVSGLYHLSNHFGHLFLSFC